MSADAVTVSVRYDGSKVMVSVRRDQIDLTLFTVNLAELMKVAPREVSAMIGARVLGAIGHAGFPELTSFAYSEMRAQREKAEAERKQNLLASGDPQGLYEVGLDNIQQSVLDSNLDLLEEADTCFRRAAAMDYEPAKNFLEVIWPSEKQECISEIKRKLGL